LSIAFTSTGASDVERVLRNAELSNISELAIEKHLETTHPECTARDVSFSVRKLQTLQTA